MKVSIWAAGIVLCIASLVFGAEVKNLRAVQDGETVIVEYDLIGGSGENQADVTVTLEVNGKIYPADALSLEGDFGQNVQTGKRKRFIWSGLNDFPQGLKGDITWEVTASSNTSDDDFVFVKGGCFQMGDSDGESDEKPAHEVCLDDFYIGKYEVTVKQFKAFVQDTGYRTEAETGDGAYGWTGTTWEKDKKYHWRNPGFPQDDSHPVVCVSWNDAQKYIAWRSRKDNRNYSLPSEAQWEYAARSGGKKEKFAGFSDENRIYHYANFCDQNCKLGWKTDSQNDGYAFTSPVGIYAPNNLHIYDMTGNIWEWCSDIYGSDAYSKHTRKNPIYTSGGSDRVVRGGSWNNSPANVRCAGRYSYSPDYRNVKLGFRLLRTP